ncbi:MAG: N-carbamoyl-D-amino-acid hydrolase [Acidimicrobiia bacterium]|nr:N-carbamoyl-D-amino-acid hydrolase [Acidimicrobiia bacterium]
MTRHLTVAAAQMGPIQRADTRPEVVERLIYLLRDAAAQNAELVAFPELALTTFFPRWVIPIEEADQFYETEMPNKDTQPLWDEATRLGVGFALGYALKTQDGHRYNVYHLVDKTGNTVGVFRKVHIPGHKEFEPWRKFQHAERLYFEPGNEFPVWSAFGGTVGMAICNDRRWSETYRVMGLQGVELVLIGYNTPLNYAPDPTQTPLQSFHNHLVMQAGAYQNGTYVIGVAKGGIEEGVESLAQSAIIAPSGQIVRQAVTTEDEVVVARIDLDQTKFYKGTLFDFERYRMPEAYESIAAAGIEAEMGLIDLPEEPGT